MDPVDHGAAACAHPSGARDLPGRGRRHDLLLRQVRLGAAQDVPKNPAEYRAFAEKYYVDVKPLLIKAGLAQG